MATRDEGFALLEELAPALLAEPDVGFGRMFGSEGLSVRGKFFAFVSSQGDLVVKLDADRIEESGLDNMVMRGRPMREWAVVPVGEGVDRWREVAREAYEFVDSITPR
ncbi:TfoX/Sxy family protein [Agromyces sp. H3Y2-19a]|uniref:TfoX/Sxy family protein n=1 Tax=Agromyces TaxID=33877 RepID=UPI001E2967AA|nr:MULTISPECIES: TfoX/Sxy family protein [Agromyces]MCD5348041.1 TfoX/Sxy family protein [Agromyces sp. S2-1-8]MDF0514360.1 TfoX/Sxy family protein [Agromyces chromiiresistens]